MWIIFMKMHFIKLDILAKLEMEHPMAKELAEER